MYNWLELFNWFDFNPQNEVLCMVRFRDDSGMTYEVIELFFIDSKIIWMFWALQLVDNGWVGIQAELLTLLRVWCLPIGDALCSKICKCSLDPAPWRFSHKYGFSEIIFNLSMHPSRAFCNHGADQCNRHSDNWDLVKILLFIFVFIC